MTSKYSGQLFRITSGWFNLELNFKILIIFDSLPYSSGIWNLVEAIPSRFRLLEERSTPIDEVDEQKETDPSKPCYTYVCSRLSTSPTVDPLHRSSTTISSRSTLPPSSVLDFTALHLVSGPRPDKSRPLLSLRMNRWSIRGAKGTQIWPFGYCILWEYSDPHEKSRIRWHRWQWLDTTNIPLWSRKHQPETILSTGWRRQVRPKEIIG